MDIISAIIPEHAAQQIARRLISETQLRNVLAQPESVRPVRQGCVVVQAMLGNYLLRVFVDIDRTPAEVVTAYRTSKIEKYRSNP